MLSDLMCYACLKEKKDLINVRKYGKDLIPYKQKLMTCLSNSLVEISGMKICRNCIKALSMCYKFLKMIQRTQESLREMLKQETITISGDEIRGEDMNENLQLKDSLYMIEGTNCLLPLELKKESTDITLTSSKYNENSTTSKEYLEPVCEIKMEHEIKIEGLVNEPVTNSDMHPNEEEFSHKDAIQKVTKQVKIKCAQQTYSCLHCDYIVKEKWQLTKHLKQIHNENKIHICSFCNKSFKHPYHLREHITTHTGERNFSCPICYKTFGRLSSQRRHIKSHYAAPGQKTKRTPFLCTICGKSFPFSNGVQRHMRVHLGIRKFECQVCKKRFLQSTHLAVHIRVHTGEKPFICAICGKLFSLKCTLEKHMKLHTVINENVEDAKPEILGK